VRRSNAAPRREVPLLGLATAVPSQGFNSAVLGRCRSIQHEDGPRQRAGRPAAPPSSASGIERVSFRAFGALVRAYLLFVDLANGSTPSATICRSVYQG
jgi:hypothetical protein